ncbi:MAG: hypothetical protein JWR62_1210, partial [Modestobacter sp.]|nr:hypothetical protein [Modestobacter sp.]
MAAPLDDVRRAAARSDPDGPLNPGKLRAPRPGAVPLVHRAVARRLAVTSGLRLVASVDSSRPRRAGSRTSPFGHTVDGSGEGTP